MAKQSAVDMAIAECDRNIADWQRAKDLILGANVAADNAAAPKVRKPRGPNKKRAGLPQPVALNGE